MTALYFTSGSFILSMGIIWTFWWMPQAFAHTHPDVHDQLRWVYLHGALMILIGSGLVVLGFRKQKRRAGA